MLQSKYDPDFQRNIEWDIPLLDGYEYEFLENTAKRKGSHHYRGIINPSILEKIEAWKPDALLVYGWKFHSHLRVMRYFKGRIPVWFRGDSTLLDERPGAASRIKKILLQWVYSHIDGAYYTGSNNKSYFRTYGLAGSQLVKAFHAVDNSRFQNTGNRYSSAAHEWKERLKIPSGNIVFLYAGKVEPKKGIETLLLAFGNLRNPNAHLLIAGDGPLQNLLTEKYAALKRVQFIDFQNQQAMPVLYQLCDVFVLPSIGPGESWGLSLNEAMAAGKTVIASDRCGGAIDLIENNRNGFIFEAGNVNDLLQKMQQVMQSKELLPESGINSLEKIQQFNFQQFVEAIENMPEKNGR